MSIQTRVFKEDMDKLKTMALASGKSEKELVHDLLTKGEEFWDDIMEAAQKKGDPQKPERQPKEDVDERRPRGEISVGESMKKIIKDAMETRVYMATLGIDLSGPQHAQQPQYPYPYPYPTPTQAPVEPRKSIMEIVAETKALKSLEDGTRDPDMKDFLREQREALTKALEAVTKARETPKEDNFNERLERIALLKTLGQDKEADKMISDLKHEFDEKITKANENTEAMKEKVHGLELKGMEDKLMKKIEDLENRPNPYETAKDLFEQAKDNPVLNEAIKLTAKKQYGIEDKKFSLEDLGKGLNSIPVGKITEMVGGIVTELKRLLGGGVERFVPPPPEVIAEQPTLTPNTPSVAVPIPIPTPDLEHATLSLPENPTPAPPESDVVSFGRTPAPPTQTAKEEVTPPAPVEPAQTARPRASPRKT